MNKSLSSIIFSLLLLVVASGCVATLGYNRSNLDKVVERGDQIVIAIDKYKQDNGYYPDKLAELVPEYLSEIPSTGVDTVSFFLPVPFPIFNDEEHFLYLKYSKSAADKESALSGYRLLVIVDPFSMFDDENVWKCLLYRSSKQYPTLRLERLVERIGDWAIVVRANGSLFESDEDSYDHFLSY